MDSTALLVVVALPFAAAAGVLFVAPVLGLRSGWVVLAGAGASFALLALVALAPGDPLFFRHPWLPSLNIVLSFRADPFGLFFAMLVAGIGVLVTLYSLFYLGPKDADRSSRYYSSLAVFMGSMLGIALADDLILLFIFWELTSVSSFLLIGHRFETADAKAGAVMALQVTALGGLVMSVGFLLIGELSGTFSLSQISDSPELVQRLLGSPLGTCALLLVFCGAFTKSAQVPFHFWLPRAMVAPTPISAYLHAATMVKAGVFLIGRMLPIFGDSPLWMPVLVSVGGATMLFGAYQSMREHDLKAILARTTASALGLLILCYGIRAAEQDALQILNHALYKGALFLIAGIVEHHTHSRDLRALGGLRGELPLPFVICVLAAASMAGLPPLMGFLAKESFYHALLHGTSLATVPAFHGVVIAASLASSALLAATAYRFTAGIFLGNGADRDHREKRDGSEGSGTLTLAPALLALTALLLGILGAGSFTRELVTAASSRPHAHLEVSLIPHLGGPLVASLVALLLAIILYRAWSAIHRTLRRFDYLPSAAVTWERLLALCMRAGELFSRRWENGSLRWYLAATALTFPLLLAYAAREIGVSYTLIAFGLTELPWYGLVYCALLGVSTIATVRARTRLAAAIASSSAGFLVAMIYVVYRSPDILLTQILIETVSTIFVVLILVHLPQFPPNDLRPGERIANAAIAGSFGLAVFVMLLLVMTPGFRETNNLATRPGGLLSLALAEGGGQNAVNVIIVDIRAIDTTGEITVLVVVGLCIYGLLRAKRESA